MASLTKRLRTNASGNFFVDSTCINCDTCRQLAPASFVENGEFSSVYHQPGGARELHQAYQALLACPVGSIGTVVPDKVQRQTAASSFPVQLEAEVFYNGFNSGKSFGANSYFICHPESARRAFPATPDRSVALRALLREGLRKPGFPLHSESSSLSRISISVAHPISLDTGLSYLVSPLTHRRRRLARPSGP